MSARSATVLLIYLASLAGLVAPLHAQGLWFRAESGIQHDTQDRTALLLDVQYGRQLWPSVTLGLEAGGSHITGPGISTNTGTVGLSASLGIPAARLGLNAAMGLTARAPDDSPTPVFEGIASFNAGAGIAVRAQAGRERYTATLTSLDTMVLATTLELALDRSDAPGWAGEAVLRRASYGDGNPVSTAYAWVLAPLSRSAGHAVRLGYAGAWQDTPESRWRPDKTIVPGGPDAAPRMVSGRYAPYYTPHDLVAHSAVANAALAVGPAWLIADGSVGMHATETAPVLFTSGPPLHALELHFFERRFTPWRGALRLVTPVDGHTTLTSTAELSRTAFYRAGTLSVVVARSL
jgi:hypothetical protein